jgi:hypothetical protein
MEPIQLQTRKCVVCAKSFRVMTTSKQATCSGPCLAESEGRPEGKGVWQKLNQASYEELQANRKQFDLRKASNEEKSKPVNATESVTPIQNSAPKNVSAEKSTPPLILTPKNAEPEKIIEKTRSNDLQTAKSGPTKTKNASWKPKGSITPKTKTASKPASTKIVKSVTLPSVLSPPSETFVLVESPSMSLLDSTANHLHGLMKGLTANQPEAEIRKYDPEIVNAACNCAKNIREIMKLKLDALKVQLKHE